MMNNLSLVKLARQLSFLAAVFTVPLICISAFYILYALPGVSIGFFQADVQVENYSGQTLYLTPITTTRGYPQVINQITFTRLAHIPVKSGRSVTISYDAADFPLSGIAACTESGPCRLLETSWDMDTITITSFSSLQALPPGWGQVIQDASSASIGFIIPLMGLVPFAFFAAYLQLQKREKLLVPPAEAKED